MSGIIKPTNLSDIESELTELGKIDLMKGDKPLFLGFDNNALQNRDNIFIAKIIKEKNLKIRFCLSHIVYDELHKNFDRSLDYEINPPQSLSFMNRFGNQIPFRYRKARIGAVEYKILSNHEYLYEIRNNATGENYDQKIINSYDTLNKNNNLVLVSGDHNFIDFAQSKNIRTIQPRFEYSYSSSYKVSWENFCDLIYVSAILFGYIEVNDDSIYGIWNGKNTDNWNNENLNIYSNYEKFSKFYKIVN